MAAGKKRILLVEDDDEAREALTAVLQLWDLEVDGARDGERALMLARENPYAAVLIDLSIPAPDGYTVARQLKAPPPAPTLIAITGRSGPAAEQKALDAGFDHFITKPVDLDFLSQLLTASGS